MKASIFKTYIFCFVLLSDFVMFAQFPTEDEEGDLQGDDEPAATINGKMIWLAIAGILFAFYRFKGSREAGGAKPLQ